MTFPSSPAHHPAPPTHSLPYPQHGAAAAAPAVAPDPSLAERYELITRLGLPTQAHPDFDKFARTMTEQTGLLYGFVNLFLGQQTFVGLHQPPAGSGHVTIGRTMSVDHGWCPEVVDRKKALPLPDVHASPRFAGNHVVDAVGIRAYFGAPLIHDSGTVLGTVCVIDPDKRSLSDARRLRDIVIETGRDVMDHIANHYGH
ncbi:GAF domain-containing protein [Streptomyces sp. NPDC006610]|uniref:GAF domain-containing protein n=1 Tax=Streptomyces sp. NPDC006610 TaxID=3154584 RepID=UPI0033BC15D9